MGKAKCKIDGVTFIFTAEDLKPGEIPISADPQNSYNRCKELEEMIVSPPELPVDKEKADKIKKKK